MITMELNKSHFLKEYRNQVCSVLRRKHPEWDHAKTKDMVEKIMMREFKNPDAKIENSYTHEAKETTLLSVIDWSIETKPIIAANGTFFKQHAKSRNPNALMLDEFLTDRKRIKKEMFAIEDEHSRVYKMKDLGQNNKKKLANSYYGGSGMKSSAFYNKFTAPCTTKSAQSVISTCETTFEAFLANNFNFADVNECFFWIDEVLKEECQPEAWVKRVGLEETYERLANVCLMTSEEEKQSLYDFLSTMDTDDLTKLYWKNNLIAFTDTHDEVKDLWDKIFQSVNDYEYMKSSVDWDVIPEKYRDEIKKSSKPEKTWAAIVDHEKFYDPNNVPDSIKEYITRLNQIYMENVYVKYMYIDRVYKLKNFTRKVVTTIDTDSNILSLDTFMEYCIDNLMHGDYGRDKMDNIFIAVNTITYTITSVITTELLYYGEMSNVEEKIRPRYSMKNEFFFANLILAKVKKRYLSKVILREGHRLTTPKYDVKGFDFKKASTSKEASEFFMKLIEDVILEPDHVDVELLLERLQEFREEIRLTIKSGDLKYLPLGSAKELEAYDDPSREQGVRGALAWNAIYPDRAVEFPTKVAILKTNIYELEDIRELQTSNPEIYENIKTQIFEDKTGIFVKRKKDGKISSEGLAVLGIPLQYKIPEWIIPYIDYATVINSVMAPFKSVTETFNIPSIDEGRTDRKSSGFSNIIRI